MIVMIVMISIQNLQKHTLVGLCPLINAVQKLFRELSQGFSLKRVNFCSGVELLYAYD